MWNLVPWPGIKPGPPALGVQSLGHWTTREAPLSSLYSPHPALSQCGFAVDLFSPVMLYIWWTQSCFPLLANFLDDVTGDFLHFWCPWSVSVELFLVTYWASWIDLIFLSTLVFLFVFSLFFFSSNPSVAIWISIIRFFISKGFFSGSLNIPLQRANLSLFPGSCTFYLFSEDSVYT